MSDAKNESEMNSPATQRQLRATEQALRGDLHAVQSELLAKIDAAHMETIHQMGALEERIISQMAGLLDPHRGVPERIAALEADVKVLKARRTRRRNGD